MGMIIKSEWEYMLEDVFKTEIVGFYETEGLAFQALQKMGKERLSPSGMRWLGLGSVYRVKRVKKGRKFY